jgi:hypothetical protein
MKREEEIAKDEQKAREKKGPKQTRKKNVESRNN